MTAAILTGWGLVVGGSAWTVWGYDHYDTRNTWLGVFITAAGVLFLTALEYVA